MKYALCVKLWQHNFTIVIVVKLLIKGLCWEKFDEKCKIGKQSLSPSKYRGGGTASVAEKFQNVSKINIFGKFF